MPAGDGPHCHLPHVHVRERRECPGRPGGDHRHRTAAPTGDDAGPLERVEREIRGLAAPSDPLSGAEAIGRVGRSDHDVPVDRELIECFEYPGARSLLGALLVGAPEPAGARQRGTLGHAGVALAEAGAPRGLLLLGNGFDSLRHQTRCSRSAALRTSSSTADVAPSRSWFQITGTSALPARSTM